MMPARCLVLGLGAAAMVTSPVHLTLRADEPLVTLHDVNRLPVIDLGPGVAARTVVGRTASFIIADLDPGRGTGPHHHTHQQANYGVAGDVTITIDGVPQSLGSDRATMVPADVEHVTRNDGSTKAQMIEMQPVRRLDLLPPRPRIAFPSRPAPQPTPSGRVVAADFRNDSAAWTVEGTERTALLKGDGVLLRVWDVRAGVANAVNLRPSATGTEQLSFLLRGAGELTVNGHVTPIAAGTLIEIAPDAARVLFRTTTQGSSRIVEFHPSAAP